MTPEGYEVLERRASSMCFDEEDTDIEWKVYDKYVPISHKLGSSNCTSVTMSWLNSGTTTERIQLDKRRQCIFGCGGEDALHHYLRCDLLWS